MMRVLLLLALCLLPGLAHARSVASLPGAKNLTLDCMAEAAQEHDVSLAALMGILAVEGGKAGEALRNPDGSFDVGPFQVNTRNLNDLSAKGFVPEAIVLDGCVNAHAAAWILRREYARTGNIWEAVGAYHSRTPQFRDAYIARVRRHLARMRNYLFPVGLP